MLRRRRGFASNQAPSPPTPPELYFAAAGITDPTEMAAVNTLYDGLITNGLYDRLDRLFLCSPTSEAACKMDFITLASLDAFGGPSFDAYGIQVDLVSSYVGSAGWKPASSTNVALAGNNAQLGFFTAFGEIIDFAGGSLAGCAGASPLTQMLKIDINADIGSYQMNGYNKDFLVSGASTSFATGLTPGPTINSRTSDSYNFTQAYWYGGYEIGVDTTMTGGTYPDVEAYFGCYNANGTPAQFVIDVFAFPYLCSMWCGGSCDEFDANTMMNLINDYNTALGRGVY